MVGCEYCEIRCEHLSTTVRYGGKVMHTNEPQVEEQLNRRGLMSWREALCLFIVAIHWRREPWNSGIFRGGLVATRDQSAMCVCGLRPNHKPTGLGCGVLFAVATTAMPLTNAKPSLPKALISQCSWDAMFELGFLRCSGRTPYAYT